VKIQGEINTNVQKYNGECCQLLVIPATGDTAATNGTNNQYKPSPILFAKNEK